LEEMLDVALFERVRQRMIITDAGKLYLNSVKRVLIDLKTATSQVMSCGGAANMLNLAVLPTFATRWLMPRLAKFLKKRPDTTINFSTRTTQFDFSVEPFDAAIHYGSTDWQGAVAHHLMDEDTVPVCSPGYETAHRIKKPADLRQAVLLHQSTRTDAWAEWFEIIGVEHPQPRRGPRYEQFAMIAQAAACGLGVALLPKILIEDELASGRLSILFALSIRSSNSYYVVVPEGKAPSQLAIDFIRWIVREARLDDRQSIPKTHEPSKES
jgi:LysR family transcriptional regulator, glycine cleavage system transcriptional activator